MKKKMRRVMREDKNESFVMKVEEEEKSEVKVEKEIEKHEGFEKK